MRAFKTISNIKKAKKEEIESIVGFSKAKLIWDYFH